MADGHRSIGRTEDSFTDNVTGEPILLGDAAANFIIVDDQDFDDVNVDGRTGPGHHRDTYPFAYPYGADDKFVVEGEVVNIDQFEEILAQHGRASPC